MKTFNRKEHWETIYSTKALNEVSWYQPTPETSLEFIKNNIVSKDEAIIDIGGGDSFLVDYLIEAGYTDITVLDISEKAIERAKLRLGENAKKATWIVQDITQFKPERKYAIWHDRAVFHFLTDPEDIQKYTQISALALEEKGKKLIGTFSESGPKKCSGIEIRQYSENTLKKTFEGDFIPLECFFENHITPFDTVQNFIFCSFEKK
ncbi:class I SAM-dependent methyltransferase [Flavobacterium sp. SM15]|uniref:class I SAM-dependent methyltransferase n=1 Tax=Flavobacterium sp. SM15 TaxID=2908005 RepID=UPI001EDB4F6A|nr:class I SAM-dependent methyltransferase [Flavobacterium sp. SM15]MCG2610630.1 class I SAM-dependent methyltransferase [Flavobacterium sp. SM15]